MGSLANKLAVPLASKLARAIAQGIGGLPPLPVPTGFDWTPPVSIYRDPVTGEYFTDFNADDWKVAATTDIWVSTTGNDTTGDGSQGNPYRGIAKAIQVANAGPDVGYNIFVMAGEYFGASSFNNTGMTRSANFIAVGGRVLNSSKFPLTSWTLDGAGTYRATRAGVDYVVDARYPTTWPNGDTTPQLLTQVASLAACQATASTWYTDGTSVWVHLQDDRVPDAGATGDVGVTVTPSTGALFNASKSYFMQGFDIQCTANVGIRARNATVSEAITQVVLDDCRVIYHSGALTRAIELDGVARAIVNNCRTFLSEGDGIGYSVVSGGNPSCFAVEIDCYVNGAGAAATHTSIQNGSTNHANGRTVRVNSVYRNTYGPVVADINATQNWCLGVDAQDCLLTSNDAQDSCFQAGTATGNTVKTWLDGCITGGAFYDLYAGANCQILYRNMAAPASTGGTGTIGTY